MCLFCVTFDLNFGPEEPEYALLWPKLLPVSMPNLT